MMFTFYLAIACAVVPMAFASHWALSEKKLHIVYPVNMVMYSLYFIAETALAFADPTQLPVLIFNIINLWGLAMAIRGYRKLKRDSHAGS